MHMHVLSYEKITSIFVALWCNEVGGRGAKNLRHTYIEASGIDHTRTYICCKMATSPPHFRKTGRTSYSIKKRLGTESTTKLLFSWPFVSGHTK